MVAHISIICLYAVTEFFRKIHYIRIESENCGTKDNLIKDVTFENVKVTLDKTSKWDCGIYDLRPAIDYGITDSKNACFYIKNAENVTIEKSSAGYGNICKDYAWGLYADNVANLNMVKFDCQSASDEYESIKII